MTAPAMGTTFGYATINFVIGEYVNGAFVPAPVGTTVTFTPQLPDGWITDVSGSRRLAAVQSVQAQPSTTDGTGSAQIVAPWTTAINPNAYAYTVTVKDPNAKADVFVIGPQLVPGTSYDLASLRPVGQASPGVINVVSTTGPQGIKGDKGDKGADSTVPGPPGVVSATSPVIYNSSNQNISVAVGTASNTVAAGNDSRFAGSAAGTSGASLSATDPTTTNARTPTGTAGGALAGTYPNPTIKAPTVTALTLNSGFSALSGYVASNVAQDPNGRTFVTVSFTVGSSTTTASPITLTTGLRPPASVGVAVELVNSTGTVSATLTSAGALTLNNGGSWQANSSYFAQVNYLGAQ